MGEYPDYLFGENGRPRQDLDPVMHPYERRPRYLRDDFMQNNALTPAPKPRSMGDQIMGDVANRLGFEEMPTGLKNMRPMREKNPYGADWYGVETTIPLGDIPGVNRLFGYK